MTTGQVMMTGPRGEDKEEFAERKRCVLIVEDDDRVREMMALLMQSEGFETVELADGIEALSYLAASEVYRREISTPDLIVTDINMPNYSGLDLLVGMREHRNRPPVMLVTGLNDEEICDEGRRLGATCVVRKPFDIDIFLDAVETSLASPKMTFTGPAIDMDIVVEFEGDDEWDLNLDLDG